MLLALAILFLLYPLNDLGFGISLINQEYFHLGENRSRIFSIEIDGEPLTVHQAIARSLGRAAFFWALAAISLLGSRFVLKTKLATA